MSNDTTWTLPSGQLSWYEGPDVRSWWDIVFPSLTVIALCAWDVLTLNVKSRRSETPIKVERWGFRWYGPECQHFVRMLLDKILMMFLCICAPAIVLTIAFIQFVVAWQSAKTFAGCETSAGKKWTRHHAAYADAGGYLLKPSDYATDDSGNMSDDGLFVVDAAQLYYLVKHKILKLEDILLSEEELKSRNAKDLFGRVIVWYHIVIYYIGFALRFHNNFGITALEVFTFSFTLGGWLFLFFWYYKPGNCDIVTIVPIRLRLQDLVNITTMGEYSEDPLDYIRRRRSSLTSYLQAWKRIFAPAKHKLWASACQSGINFPDMDLPAFMTGWAFVPLLLQEVIYMTFFLAYTPGETFPTQIEQTIWRLSAVLCSITMMVFWGILCQRDNSRTSEEEFEITQRRAAAVNPASTQRPRSGSANDETPRQADTNLRTNVLPESDHESTSGHEVLVSRPPQAHRLGRAQINCPFPEQDTSNLPLPQFHQLHSKSSEYHDLAGRSDPGNNSEHHSSATCQQHPGTSCMTACLTCSYKVSKKNEISKKPSVDGKHDKHPDLPSWVFSSLNALATIYILCRLAQVAVAFSSLRSQPAKVYLDPAVSQSPFSIF